MPIDSDRDSSDTREPAPPGPGEIAPDARRDSTPAGSFDLDDLTIADAQRFRTRLRRARSARARAAIGEDVERARAIVERRRASVPAITYPPDLPVTAARDRIAEAIRDHRVVIVAGETGSGKTTQLPKICLDLGLGVRGMIGHTQPRRLAARSVSERIAHELGEQIGNHVGYQVRFTDTSTPSTLVKVMTDGILLNEINRDRRLSAYDTIIIDEAHERSLNIDFILGYLARLLQVRDDLKVIVTSATIDPERFVEHFRKVGIEAPIIEVSGRTYPVEVRYRPLTVEVGEEVIDLDEVDGVCDAVSELLAEGDGDILVFLSGEREIRDTADALRDRKFRNLEILPLYGRLSAAEQHRVFQSHSGRRVILSTNVAETSLTVPGIRYVVDPGTARISRYSLRSKVQRLPIEPISQASARQRSGRCGRVADGICIRLYSEEDFDARPAFTEPEIQRTNLASVVLRMAALGLGRIEDFPFVDPPDPRAVRDGIAVLTELGALAGTDERPPSDGADTATGLDSAAPGPRLTPVGRELAGIPLDPRMARMLHEANRTGVLAEVLVIVAALSIQDVRERPTEHRGAADSAHARFNVPGSDFLAYLRLWDYLRLRRDQLSSSAFRRMCRTEYLHYLRVREWQDLHGQLRGIVRDLGWTVDRRDLPESAADDGPPPLVADADRVHRAILAGLLTHIGLREGETREFAGVRGTKFAIFPASSLANKPPRWVMAGELVETSRLWARTVGRIEPEWVEQLAGHLVKRQYAEPHWSSKREAAMIRERVTLFGVPLVTGRPVQLSRIDPAHARELFIRHALVEGEWRGRHRFLDHNRRLLEDTEDLENRARRRDILVDDDALFDFYDRRIDDEVITARQFDAWWKRKRRETPDLLDFTVDVVTNPEAAGLDEAAFPRIWQQGEVRLDLTYLFEPGNADDGVTATIPASLLDHVRSVGFDWLVPGMRHDLATALIRTLPKELRRRVVPAPDIATAALARMPVRTRPFVDALAAAVVEVSGVPVVPGNFRPDALDPHLRMGFRVVDDSGREVGRSRDLEALRVQVRGTRPARPAAAAAAAPTAVEWTAATFGTLQDEVTRTVRGMAVTAYPGLSVDGSGAGPSANGAGGATLRMYPSRISRDRGHRRAVARLAARRIHPAAGSLLGSLGTRDRLALSQSPYPSAQALVDDIVLLLVAEQAAAAPAPMSAEEFEALVTRIRPAVNAAAPRTLRAVAAILASAAEVTALLGTAATQRFPDAAADVREQVEGLIFDGFVFDTGSEHLADLPRYLTGARMRLEALPASADRDRVGMVALDRVFAQYAQALEALPEGARLSEGARQPAWMIEELRISLFAQGLGTAYPISEKRVARTIAALVRR